MIYFYFRPDKNLIYEKQLLYPAKHITLNISCWKNVNVLEGELREPALIPKAFKEL